MSDIQRLRESIQTEISRQARDRREISVEQLYQNVGSQATGLSFLEFGEFLQKQCPENVKRVLGLENNRNAPPSCVLKPANSNSTKRKANRKARSTSNSSPRARMLEKAVPRFDPKTDGFQTFVQSARRLSMSSCDGTISWNEIRIAYRKETGRHLNSEELNQICGTRGMTKHEMLTLVLSCVLEPVDTKGQIVRLSTASFGKSVKKLSMEIESHRHSTTSRGNRNDSDNVPTNQQTTPSEMVEESPNQKEKTNEFPTLQPVLDVELTKEDNPESTLKRMEEYSQQMENEFPSDLNDNDVFNIELLKTQESEAAEQEDCGKYEEVPTEIEVERDDESLSRLLLESDPSKCEIANNINRTSLPQTVTVDILFEAGQFKTIHNGDAFKSLTDCNQFTVQLDAVISPKQTQTMPQEVCQSDLKMLSYEKELVLQEFDCEVAVKATKKPEKKLRFTTPRARQIPKCCTIC